MRSKLGTKSRLAAHILALLLLILMLVYLGPAGAQVTYDAKHTPMRPTITLPPNAKHESDVNARRPQSASATLDRIHTPSDAERVPTESLRPPEEPPVEEVTAVRSSAEEIVEEQPARTAEATEEPDAPTESLERKSDVRPHLAEEPAANMEKESSQEDPDVARNKAVNALLVEELAPMPAEPAMPESEEAVRQPAGSTAADAQTPPEPQPDESGSLVVAGTESSLPVAAATPLSNANLQVLGDGVYWLDSRHDVAEELAAIPEIGTLIFLTPLPGYHTPGFEHVKTEAIPADSADLTRDAAERYLHLTGNVTRPVVTAVVPGTRGAAFFKGVYLLSNRKMDMDELLLEIEPELAEAGASRDEIVHRLMRFRDN